MSGVGGTVSFGSGTQASVKSWHFGWT